MKRLLFQNLLLLSLKERKGRKIAFHPKVTIIKGANDTGKSCLIKSIYQTLGAETPSIPSKWKDADVISIIEFLLDGQKYKVLNHGSLFCLFDDSAMLGRYTSITKGLSLALSKLFNFKLPLKSKNGREETQATPAFLFLPFYFDQDRSWQKQWNSFDRLQQFPSNWKPDLVNFHSGIKPTEYFEAKIKKGQLEDRKSDLTAQKELLNKTRYDIEKRLKLASFSLDIEAYQREINDLLKQCQQLKTQEENMKEQMLNLHSKKCVLIDQKHIVEASLKELTRDYQYAVDKLPDDVKCPTCGHSYNNSFNERFNIAQDEYRCQELLEEINKELEGINNKLNSLDKSVKSIKHEHYQIKTLLETKQGEIKLEDVIKSAGRQEVDNVLREELTLILSEIFDINNAIDLQNKVMDKFEDKDRKNEIKSKYLALMKNFLNRLDVMFLPENNYKRLDCSINQTGSDLPRALLAYYFSLLNIINEFSTSTFCPIVLDSAKQQDQDTINWRKMLNFMKEEQPLESQFIMGLVDDLDIDFGGTVIELTDKYSLLRKDEFDSVYEFVCPLLEEGRR